MRVALDKNAKIPTRAHSTDAGLDIYALHDGIVPAGGTATFHTGVHVEIPNCAAGVLQPKSGLMVNKNVLTFGVVDEGYDGEVMVHVFNFGKNDFWVEKGDKISQLLVVEVRYEPVEIVDSISGGERGDNGFGSTGR